MPPIPSQPCHLFQVSHATYSKFCWCWQVLMISSEEDQPRVLTVGPIFSPLAHLEEVHITRANVPAIGENSFWGLKHLRLLNLTHNNVSSIRSHHLSGMRTLQALHLDYNKIDSVSSATFMSLDKLEVLTLANNHLRGLTPRMFFLLSSLKTLDLSGNPIRELDPEVLKDLPSLRVLRCSNCEITRIRSLVYKNVLELEELDLRDNKIEILSAEEYIDLKYLKTLYLDGNRLFELRDYVFRGLGLRYLGLSRNHMEKISRTAFDDCTVLTLDLSINKLSFSALRHLYSISEHLHDLNLSNNKISVHHMTELLRRALRLKQLDMSRMHLKMLPADLFETQLKLISLNLAKNNLKFLTVETLHSLPNLQVLDLSDNNIQGLPEVVLRRLDRISKVYLTRNPWNCDQCHIPYMKTWINNSKEFRDACVPNVDAPNCLKCQLPVEMYDKPIIEVDGLSLQPCPEGSLISLHESGGSSAFTLILVVSISSVVILLLVIILFVGIIMYNRHSAYYYTHENGGRCHFYDNPGLQSNHTDVTMADDLDKLPQVDVEDTGHPEPSSIASVPQESFLPNQNAPAPTGEPSTELQQSLKLAIERRKKRRAPMPNATS
ncbi:Leucine-rich repeat [Trinorchestia longiramus]|nr:Leucine-rich repeat [Trinorchestia longiramus]